jgi:hypothetical protein
MDISRSDPSAPEGILTTHEVQDLGVTVQHAQTVRSADPEDQDTAERAHDMLYTDGLALERRRGPRRIGEPADDVSADRRGVDRRARKLGLAGLFGAILSDAADAAGRGEQPA